MSDSLGDREDARSLAGTAAAREDQAVEPAETKESKQDWTVPPPPTRERVEEQIRRLKAGTEWSTIVELDIGRDQTLSGRSWGDLTEAQKLGQLGLGTDLMLLDPQERHEILAREVDFARIAPTRDQIEATIERIKELSGITYMEGEEYDAGDQHPPRPGLEPIPFHALTSGDRVELLAMLIDWEGFTDAQRGTVIRRVIEGQAPESWMEGIAPPGETRALAEEIRQDEHAARVRDYGEADAATYDARMAEAYRYRADALGAAGAPERTPVADAEVERIVSELERGWAGGRSITDGPRYDPTAAAQRSKPMDKDRGPTR